MQVDRLVQALAARGIPVDVRGEAARAAVEEVVIDSRRAGPGKLFAARKSRKATVDGHAFVAEAAERGAAAVLGELPLESQTYSALARAGVPYLRVDDAQEALAHAAAVLEGDPSRKLSVVAVTGTNGKTTTATLLQQLFTELGERAGLIATTGIVVGERTRPNDYTTPDAPSLQRTLAEMVRAGCAYCFMEATSHGIDQRRIAAVEFAGGIYTNLSPEHLDYHDNDLEAYAETKRRFFSELPRSAFAVTNADDERGAWMVEHTAARIVTYGTSVTADRRLEVLREGPRGITLQLGPLGPFEVSVAGAHNASNLAAGLTAAEQMGVSLETAVAAASGLKPPPGRLQRVYDQGAVGIVDFAHTPHALEVTLRAVRRMYPGRRLIVVGGCGGDRDRQKRPEMGRLLATGDLAFLTSDNPRSEDPDAIIDEMLEGVAPGVGHVHRQRDRRRAIAQAAAAAGPGDVVLVTGKGHETTQEIAGVHHELNDGVELEVALDKLADDRAAELRRRAAGGH